MVTAIGQFIGKLIGLGIVAAAVIGLVVILSALLIGCTAPQQHLFLVKTLQGASCVQADSYRTSEGCTTFYTTTFMRRSSVLTICGQHIVGYTTPDVCRSVSPAEQAQ